MTSGRTARIQKGERSNRRDVRPETDGREETYTTVWLLGSSTWRKRLTQYPARW